ncbi:hypothetical protein AB9N12_04495 [Bacteroides sp. AN502(2024)]|uniref:hypothetical protein n=1 Tax=Bacteroides sp. AN502(2024) TaxID=3160599 RepID=UPI003519A82C
MIASLLLYVALEVQPNRFDCFYDKHRPYLDIYHINGGLHYTLPYTHKQISSPDLFNPVSFDCLIGFIALPILTSYDYSVPQG